MLEICSFHRGASATSAPSHKLSAANPKSTRPLTIDPQFHLVGVQAGNSFGMTSFANAEIEKRPSTLGLDNNPSVICKLADVRQEAANCFRITSFSNVSSQPLWNDTVHKKGGGYSPSGALAVPNIHS